MFTDHINDNTRQEWLQQVLGKLQPGLILLDAGAGELRNREYCKHLEYVSQDFGQYSASGKGQAAEEGYHNTNWDTSGVDIICDITEIPRPDESFDVIVCTEVLEHLPDPTKALDEFTRLLKDGGKLILTAPFSSVVHMAPYYFSTGFSKYWYEHHLATRGYRIDELTANGDWFSVLKQELSRLGSTERECGNWSWPLAYGYTLLGYLYFWLRSRKKAANLACFGWFCVATKTVTSL